MEIFAAVSFIATYRENDKLEIRTYPVNDLHD